MAEQRSYTGSFNNRWKFTGKELDEETGLYYFGARFYNPVTSLWLSVDPLAEKGPEYSPYCYTFNNPINLTDPDGRWPDPPTMKSMSRNLNINLNKNANVYVLQEIPQRNHWGQIMHIPDISKRLYQRIQINVASPDYNGKDIYVTEYVAGTTDGGKSHYLGYTYNEVNGSKTYDIAFEKNSNTIKDDENYNSNIKQIVESINKTGEMVNISGATSSSDPDRKGPVKINGSTVQRSANELASDRANTIYNDLIDQGANKEQLNITPTRTNVPNRNTQITITKAVEIQGIKQKQIKE